METNPPLNCILPNQSGILYTQNVFHCFDFTVTKNVVHHTIAKIEKPNDLVVDKITYTVH